MGDEVVLLSRGAPNGMGDLFPLAWAGLAGVSLCGLIGAAELLGGKIRAGRFTGGWVAFVVTVWRGSFL